MVDIRPDRLESLGPAETIIETVINFGDHLWHGRPGVVRPSSGPVPTWTAVTDTNRAAAQAGHLGDYRQPGMFAEAARHIYAKALAVHQMDADLAARWASYEFAGKHRDLKVVLAALMLVQEHAGDPVMEHGKVAFHDDDYREVGEAILLHYRKGDRQMLSPKHIARVYELLSDPVIAQMNREAGFGRSARRPPIGRYYKTLERWLRHREHNPALLEGLSREGWRSTVKKLAQWCGYKPLSPRFFEVLRWKQTQAADGRRAIGMDLQFDAPSWDGLSEAEICALIVADRPSFKTATGMLPAEVGLTPAIVAALIEAGGVSDRDLIILTPTLEELGLLNDADIRARWDAARGAADDQRARNIARNVRAKELREGLSDAADDALRKDVAEATRGLQVLFLIDKSASMTETLEQAKELLSLFVQSFPPDQLHVAVFDTTGRVLRFRSHSEAGVRHALSKFTAGGGTDYAAPIQALAMAGVRVPAGDDCVVFTVGDQNPHSHGEIEVRRFMRELRAGDYDPIGFCHLHVGARGDVVQRIAATLDRPFVQLGLEQFTDPYGVHRTLRAALESAPRRASRGPSLLQKILATELLLRPY
jgi:hypothetical protein